MKGPDRRCPSLRNGVANVVSSAIHRYLETHSAILPFVDAADMQRYHDIYDLSRQDYQEMLQPLTPASEDDPESLRGLKTSLVRLFIARQILFCDLLALPSVSPMSDFRLWSVVSDEVANLSRLLRASATTLEHLVNEEDSRQWGDGWKAHSRGLTRPDKTQASENPAPETPGKQHVEAQLRRLDALSNSIRGLNAKMLLMRDEANNLIGDTAQSSDISSMLARQYDLIGADLKTLILEWENGRTTMLLSVGAFDRASLSRSSSELRSPRSPVHSLGGSTAVNEGSPAEAWKRLSGGSRDLSNDGLLSDEEVFEGVSLPPKVKRLSMMTREEKLAKMQEDRRKRATFQESRDATTNMLRELETVIKHRPRGRTTSRITTTT